MLTPEDVARLLADLCVRSGFCLPPDERQRLQASPPSDVDSFTDAVFAAEGLPPELAGRRLYRLVHGMVESAFHCAEERDA